jgi:hypothetical protein
MRFALSLPDGVIFGLRDMATLSAAKVRYLARHLRKRVKKRPVTAADSAMGPLQTTAGSQS